MLYAHALELSLKGLLVAIDPSTDVRSFRHNLAALYHHCGRSGTPEATLLKETESAVRIAWRNRLRGARDAYEAHLGAELWTPSQRMEFRIIDNEDLGRMLDSLELRKQVIWLSERHTDDGGEFRYPRLGWQRRPKVNLFFLRDDVVRTTIGWACEDLQRRLKEF
ncbi:MAG: hypothetical protein AAFR47_20005, partial [Pseudomonadota bacterium]